MKNFIFIVFLFPMLAKADHPISGLWESYVQRGHMTGSHILEVNEKGIGFYAFTIGNSMSKSMVFKIDVSNKKYINGYMTIDLYNDNIKKNYGFKLILAPDLGSTINSMTLMHHKNEPELSLIANLQKASKAIKYQSFYEFAKSNL